MNFTQTLQHELGIIRQAGLLRELRLVEGPQGTHLRVGGGELLNFSSNDYLGLANHPAVREAARAAVEQFGAGSGASRLICGSLAPHHELEEALAAFKGTPAALTFGSGFATALGVITALLGAHDVVILDKLAHACMVDAARQSGAQLRIFRHNDLNHLEDLLTWADTRRQAADAARTAPVRILVATESLFSMDGDLAPLRELVELKDRYGAWLMLDEAHATGLFGPGRRGLAEAAGVSDRVEIQMGTLGKALGSAGGFIAGPADLRDFLLNRARSFIFSTAPVPAAAAAARAAIAVVAGPEGEERCAALWAHAAQLRAAVQAAGFDRGVAGPIFPLVLGDEDRAVRAAARLREAGFLVPAVRYPAVGRGQARLRATLTASHTAEEVARLAAWLPQISG
jgi:8-amino-7-oxononanoate synthase